MNAEYIKVKGKLRWTKALQVAETWDGPNGPESHWNVTVYPDSPSLEIIRELQGDGLKNKLKKDEDGWFVKFKRPTKRTIGGKKVDFEAPELTLNGEPLKEFIGNGSDAEVTLEVYKHRTPGGGNSVAARLVSVNVTSLVPYEKQEQNSEEGF